MYKMSKIKLKDFEKRAKAASSQVRAEADKILNDGRKLYGRANRELAVGRDKAVKFHDEMVGHVNHAKHVGNEYLDQVKDHGRRTYNKAAQVVGEIENEANHVARRAGRTYSVVVNVGQKHIDALKRGAKTISLTANDLKNGARRLRLSFNAKKHLNRLERNFRDGKRSTIKPDVHLDDVEEGEEVEGGAINFKSIKRGLTDVGRKIVKAVKPVVDSKITKSIVKEAAPILLPVAKEAVVQAVGAKSNPVVGKAAGNVFDKMAKKGVDSYTKGAGVRRMSSFPRSSGFTENHGGSFKPLGGSSAPHGGSIEGIQFQQSALVPGPNSQISRSQAPVSVQERMAYVRSFRGGTKQG
jgi:hypothetical protein